MTMLSTLSTTVSTLLLGSALSVPAPSNPVAAMNHQVRSVNQVVGHGGDFMRICKKVECTTKQRAALREIGATFREQVKPLRAQQREIRKELVAAFSRDQLNDRELAQLYTRLDRVHSRILAERRSTLEAAHAILSPDQRDDVAKVLAGAGKGKRKGKSKGKGKGKGKGHKHAGPLADADIEDGSADVSAPEGGEEDGIRGRGKAKSKKAKRSKRRRGKGTQAKLDRQGGNSKDTAKRERPDRRPKQMNEPQPPQSPGPQKRVQG